MSTLVIEAPGLASSQRVAVPEGDTVLVGREPSPATLSLDAVFPASTVASTATVMAPSVSGNHLVVRREGDSLHLCDLGSRNGTWLRVPPRRVVTVPASDEVRVQLGDATLTTRAGVDPAEPRYVGRDDFGKAVAASVTEWLRRRQTVARVRVADADRGSLPDADSMVCFPLASGARMYLEFDQTVDMEVQRCVESLWSWITRQNQAYRSEDETRADGMILASAEIRRAHRLVVESARRGIQSLMFLGPSGAGKERLARAFHRHSGRGGPFIAVNCSMLDRNLARADLFGADIGAYTGCVRARVGAVERAHGGTLFLDEVGDMPAEVQPLLLRFLDDQGEFERMGGDGRLRHADVRVVCATNKNLREESLRGGFRKDLWWRLSVQVVEVPPLRRRFDDAAAYLQLQTLGDVSAFDALTPAAHELLRRHPWEGNFRELANFVRRLPPASRPHEITEAEVRTALFAGALSQTESEPPRPAPMSEVGSWEGMVQVAAACFIEDHGSEVPAQWGDVGTFIEQYLKPVVLRRMVSALEVDGVPATTRELSQRLQADAKTISKHLHRYSERFSR